LSIIAIPFLAVSGWLGGSLVYVHGVAVDIPQLLRNNRNAWLEAGER